MREVISELGYDRMSHEDVRESFDCIIRNIEDHMFALYEQYEQKVNAVNIPQRLLDNNPDELQLAEDASRFRGFREGVLVLFSHLYPELRKEFSSVSQSRMARGGRSFESQFACLLRLVGSHLNNSTASIELISSCQAMQRSTRTVQCVQ